MSQGYKDGQHNKDGGEFSDLRNIPGDPAEAFGLPKNVELLKGDDPEFALVKNPICRRFFMLFRIIGTILTVLAVMADVTYFFKQQFSNRDLYIAFTAVLGLRVLHAFLLIAKNLCYNVCRRSHNRMDAAEAYEERDDKEEAKQLSPE